MRRFSLCFVVFFLLSSCTYDLLNQEVEKMQECTKNTSYRRTSKEKDKFEVCVKPSPQAIVEVKW